jgi:T-complex protein 1 subunit gamma
MKRRIEKPRVILLDCNLEYKKGENMTNIEITRPEHWEEIMKQEEEHVKKQVDAILKFKPDLVLTEKGVSDLAQHFFVKAGVTCLRRLKKTDNDRIARAVGATIVHEAEDLREADVGTGCELFEIKKIGDEYFTFITGYKPKACTILLRGAGKDILNEIERNLQDALHVAKNVYLEPLLLPGGGATEMSTAVKLQELAKAIPGVEQYAYQSIGLALEVIPRTLIQNCGTNVVRTITQLRAKHAAGEGSSWGIDGDHGSVRDMKEMGLYEPYAVKVQTLKTAVEASCLLLKVDDIVSGLSQKGAGGGQGQGGPQFNPEDLEQ